jgi:glycosyltransferase involved in cell wall biosynthesis
LINFISSLPPDLRSGGFSAMNAAAYDALSKLSEIHYAGPISPPPYLAEKIRSKILRICGAQGDFFFFSSRRLLDIADRVKIGSSGAAELDFFHGFTPWILTEPTRPYVAWSDCTFRDYIDIYHSRGRFRPGDLERIERSEADWLNRTRCIAFTSRWAARRAIDNYGLDESAVHCVGIFGEIEPADSDAYQGRGQFMFVSTNFAAKGGPVVLAAFRQVRDRHPDASLVIVGAQPSVADAEANVTYAGYLRKEVASESRRFREILAQSRALVHPTTSDIAPLIIVEAGYFGCPAISVRKFAIPELIEHRASGLLVDDATNVAAVTEAMNWMLEQEAGYVAMRRQVWCKARTEHSKQAFEQRMQALVQSALDESLPQPPANPLAAAQR